VQLPNRTSLLIYADKKNLPKPTELRQGVQVMPLALALVRVSPGFSGIPPPARRSPAPCPPGRSQPRPVGRGGFPAAAGRLVGAFRHCGLTEQANRLAADLTAAGLEFDETTRSRSAATAAGLLFTRPMWAG